jgi:hypothetical protein
MRKCEATDVQTKVFRTDVSNYRIIDISNKNITEIANLHRFSNANLILTHNRSLVVAKNDPNYNEIKHLWQCSPIK